MKSTEQALSDALNAGVSAALGELRFQVIALTAERDVLKAQLDALTRDDARPPVLEGVAP